MNERSGPQGAHRQAGSRDCRTVVANRCRAVARASGEGVQGGQADCRLPWDRRLPPPPRPAAADAA